MKILYISFLINICFFINSVNAQHKNIPIIKSNKKSIFYQINNKQGDWSVSPAISPDRLEVFCPKEKKNVRFITDKDTISFMIGANDTVQFIVLLNNNDKALTEVVGFDKLPNKITQNEKIYYLSLFWSEVKYNFVNMDNINFSLDSLYQAYIPKVIKTKNDYQFFQLLQKFAAKLNDGHTQIVDNGQFYIFRDYIPITFKSFDDKIHIVSIRKGINIDSTFVGAELLSVSSIPIKKYLQDSVLPYISASTTQHLLMQGVFQLHSNFSKQTFNAKVKKTNGEIVNITLPYNGEATRTINDEYWGTISQYSHNIVEYKKFNKNITYLSINSFHNKAIKLINKRIKDINKSEGVIIDLRKNGGGSTDVAWYLQSILSQQNYFLNYAWQTRINNGVKRANGNWIEEYKDFSNDMAMKTVNSDTIFISDTIQKINVPIIMLIGNYTFSAAEDFLINLYEIKDRPILIGEETGGSTGSPLVVPLPNNAYGRICTRRVCFPYTKKPFVNKGIKPDIIIKQSLDNYLQKKDVVLEKALEILNE